MITSKAIRVLMFSCLAVFAASGVVGAEKAVSAKAKANPTGPALVWHDCQKLGVEGKGWADTLSLYDRLPGKAQSKVPKAVWGLSHDSAGMCVRFTTDAPSIQVRWTLLRPNLAMEHMPATGVSGVDLYVKDNSRRWQFAGNGPAMAVSNTSKPLAVPADQQCLLYLPLYNGVKSVEIGIPKGRTISACPAVSKPIVFYGTSITQGGCASRPGMAFTAIIGRKLDTPVINLGFSGNGKMEPEMADLLAELDPSVYVLDCIANMTSQQVSERVAPFVKKLRETHPNTPILLAEDSSFRNVCPTTKGRVLRVVYEKLTAEGVKHLHFLSSQGMLGVDGEGTVDGCHPNDLGMMRLADAFVQSLGPIVQVSRP